MSNYMNKKYSTIGIIALVIVSLGIFLCGCTEQTTSIQDKDQNQVDQNLFGVSNTNKLYFEPRYSDCSGFTGPFSMRVDEYVSCSFCQPSLKSTSDLCDSSATNPTGGQPPYHFQLDSGSGFPPMGMSLNLNGILAGTPTQRGKYNFKVCAVDLSGNQACKPIEIQVITDKDLEEMQGSDCERWGCS